MQHDLIISDQNFPAFRTDLNNAIQSIATANAGATAPSSPIADMLWLDTSTTPAVLKKRNSANTAWLGFGTTDLYYSGTLTGGTGVVNIGSGQIYKDASGNVGIGRTAPVNFGANWTSLEISGKNSSSGGVLRLSTSDASAQADFYIDTQATLRTTTNHAFVFGTNAIERMRITSAGVGIGTSSPNASAILDVQSTTKGVRMPNMTTSQKNAIASPAAGLMVFDTTLAKMCVYTGVAWQTMTSA